MPIAQNTTANSSSLPRTVACLATWAAAILCGNPASEKNGSFWPLTSEFIASMVDMPVWINSLGGSLAAGFITDPKISLLSEPIGSGIWSSGLKLPLNTLPIKSSESGICMTSPVNLTDTPSSNPSVIPKTWTIALSLYVSRTFPIISVPSDNFTSTSSL